jgi:hypothetical protein
LLAVLWRGEGIAAERFAEAKNYSLAVSVSLICETVNGTDALTRADAGTFQQFCNNPPRSSLDGAAAKKEH